MGDKPSYVVRKHEETFEYKSYLLLETLARFVVSRQMVKDTLSASCVLPSVTKSGRAAC